MQSASVSANLVEICDSLRNLDFCALHLRRTMEVVNITLTWISENEIPTGKESEASPFTVVCCKGSFFFFFFL